MASRFTIKRWSFAKKSGRGAALWLIWFRALCWGVGNGCSQFWAESHSAAPWPPESQNGRIPNCLSGAAGTAPLPSSGPVLPAAVALNPGEGKQRYFRRYRDPPQPSSYRTSKLAAGKTYPWQTHLRCLFKHSFLLARDRLAPSFQNGCSTAVPPHPTSSLRSHNFGGGASKPTPLSTRSNLSSNKEVCVSRRQVQATSFPGRPSLAPRGPAELNKKPEKPVRFAAHVSQPGARFWGPSAFGFGVAGFKLARRDLAVGAGLDPAAQQPRKEPKEGGESGQSLLRAALQYFGSLPMLSASAPLSVPEGSRLVWRRRSRLFPMGASARRKRAEGARGPPSRFRGRSRECGRRGAR